MTALVLGLLVFLGLHSVRIFAEPWRTATVARLGEGRWKGLYSLGSAAGLLLIVWGFGMARQDPTPVWIPPLWTRHLAALLTLIAFVMITAAYVPRNAIKARLHDPMILGVKVWALAHLLSNGALHEIILFGSFLAWAILDFRAARRRRATAGSGTGEAAPRASATAITVVSGIVAWAIFAFFLHRLLIGVQPLP